MSSFMTVVMLQKYEKLNLHFFKGPLHYFSTYLHVSGHLWKNTTFLFYSAQEDCSEIRFPLTSPLGIFSFNSLSRSYKNFCTNLFSFFNSVRVLMCPLSSRVVASIVPTLHYPESKRVHSINTWNQAVLPLYRIWKTATGSERYNMKPKTNYFKSSVWEVKMLPW